MRAKVTALVLGWLVCLGPAPAADGVPEWLPPPKPRPPIWDLVSEVPVSRPGETFTDLLSHVARPPADSGARFDAGRLKLSRESSLQVVSVQSSLELPDARQFREAPYLSRDWTAEESLKVPLPAYESMFVYGSFDSSGDYDNNRQVRLRGKTGLGWKWAPFSRSEVQVRTGPVVSYADVYNPASQERSQLSVELQAKLDLFGPLQLKYSGEALPRVVPADRHTLWQDLKLAVPFGTNREFHLGANYRWEDRSTTPWMDRAQLYLGLKFQH